MNASHPARQMTLVGETCASGNFSQAESPVAGQFDRAAQSQMNNVTVGADSKRSRKYAGEMIRTAPNYTCERGDRYGLIQVSHDVVPQPLKHALAQPAARLAFVL